MRLALGVALGLVLAGALAVEGVDALEGVADLPVTRPVACLVEGTPWVAVYQSEPRTPPGPCVPLEALPLGQGLAPR